MSNSKSQKSQKKEEQFILPKYQRKRNTQQEKAHRQKTNENDNTHAHDDFHSHDNANAHSHDNAHTHTHTIVCKYCLGPHHVDFCNRVQYCQTCDRMHSTKYSGNCPVIACDHCLRAGVHTTDECDFPTCEKCTLAHPPNWLCSRCPQCKKLHTGNCGQKQYRIKQHDPTHPDIPLCPECKRTEHIGTPCQPHPRCGMVHPFGTDCPTCPECGLFDHSGTACVPHPRCGMIHPFGPCPTCEKCGRFTHVDKCVPHKRCGLVHPYGNCPTCETCGQFEHEGKPCPSCRKCGKYHNMNLVDCVVCKVCKYVHPDNRDCPFCVCGKGYKQTCPCMGYMKR